MDKSNPGIYFYSVPSERKSKKKKNLHLSLDKIYKPSMDRMTTDCFVINLPFCDGFHFYILLWIDPLIDSIKMKN